MRVELHDLDPDSLDEVIGPECYDAAREYVRRGAIVQMVWVAERDALCGCVRGRSGQFYTPAVYFARDHDRGLQVRGTQCSCPVMRGCEHAAALLLAASATADPAGGDASGTALGLRADRAGGAHRPGGTQRSATWDQSLDLLLNPHDDDDAPQAAQTLLAVELTLIPDVTTPRASRQGPRGGPPVKLMGRLMQPGKNGGWVAGSLSWASSTAITTTAAIRPRTCGCCGR